ncbi:MAG: thermonuclease family protein [Rubrobacteraceae bacterium]
MILRALLLLAGIALLFGCGPAATSGAPGRGAVEVTVSRVVDGDTVEVSPAIAGEEDVRLIVIDTPEVAGAPGGAQPYGAEAERFTRRELEGENVTLKFDEEAWDDYGRVLAYLYAPDGTMFNQTLLEKGYAQVATFPPNVRHAGRFEEAQRSARRAEEGIWNLPEARLCRLTDRGNGVGGGC